ncbi:phosphopantetheine-binding protein [Methylobacterium sp. sgz302541]|uniref:phosphopantetheine-binding protein n=1 Tax=unclassified Methylobacterium TaxID=2615210 RepID=UPI003D327F63
MSTRSIVIDNIVQVAAEQDKALAPMSDDLVLLESGLDSLCFAILVSRLEDALGVDPFTASDEIVFPVTVGEFIALYESAMVDVAA